MKRVLWILVWVPAAAFADDNNFRPYLIGSRAGGMGGAFTALADDPSGPYYNPAGIAHVKRTQLSLSGSLFGVVHGNISDALGDGNDFGYSDLQTFPIQTSAVYKLGPEAPEDSPHALAISIFVPTSIDLDDRDDLGTSQSSFVHALKEDAVWAGVSYARRFGQVALGASVYGVLENATEQLDLTAIIPVDPSMFANVFGRSDELRLGVVGALGARFDVSDEVRLGLSVFSPSIGVYTNRQFYARILVGDVEGSPAQAVVNRADGLSSTPALPARAQAGVAWTSGDVTVTADVIVLFPREVLDNPEAADVGGDRWIVRNLVVNGAAGVEVLLAPTVPFRFGAWTDLAAADAPTADGPDNSTRLNRLGGSVSIGLRGEHTESSLNVNMSYAWGETLIPDNFDFTVFRPTNETQLGVFFVVASSFQF